MPEITLRNATIDDLDAITSLHIASARAAYAPIFGETYAGGDPERRRESWRRILEHDPTLEPPGADLVYVATHGGRLISFAAVGRSRDPDAGPAGEVHALYVSTERQHSGVGTALLAAATDWLRQGGFPDATLWVLETNKPARALYEKNGWHPDGGRKPAFSGPNHFQMRYRLALSSP